MLNLHPVPAFTDNYIWCLHDNQSAYVVDPGQADPVLDYLNDRALTLRGILITHHHWDHVSGIEALLQVFPGIPVWGPAREDIPCCSQPLAEGDQVNLDWGLVFRVLEVPGHTLGHIAYYAETTPLGPLLFCGDTLFSSGCGRLFEGTPQQMHQSLQALSVLPVETLVCCTHEYTTANLAFAQAVEPQNAAIQERIAQVAALRDQNLPSLPSSIGLEQAVNPFLRVTQSTVLESLQQKCGERPATEVESFATLRHWKDNF
ncbi:MAG: hydroxyacylglutathione hydrolase [Pseudomonadales bacterium]|jgi:hydroxyacylglutathione hydrolase|uniref:hydroxyacylglutathione hydrolase n=1 Tax=unclassified Ketobacter TaxID=2639109 RepID=UPI000C538A3A|nr:MULTISPECIES: hydroxyacylglutathione hydrolase [unclassified Ketobacter]MAQ26734.1 hydroxyacylglutathione hydrolase [Pseudomonadales bacterium]MEC8809997.1 hydroxyacylglutathione hydrolase [Pseudomonadota bacterium]TNC88802.1 MAG: hydroxyacylglutathione hydrolase [Alcanivorax sp.]HAG96006.1 hydroxyacylglutathione hydrolase [Gammaproteobacteria bacterium]MBI28174.1 hydroxyacylglutathione hydrolase [Pseudomonadales bacterium]|tara:strand:+ start:233 stop:1012 length:780 start_codon:yes stop_codon:yes gene_type:complete